MSDEQQEKNSEPQGEKEKTRLNIHHIFLDFGVDFEKVPSAGEFCDAIIALFQHCSVAFLSKENIEEVLRKAHKTNSGKFSLNAVLNRETKQMEIRFQIMKPSEEPTLIIPPSAPNVKKLGLSGSEMARLNRAQRRRK